MLTPFYTPPAAKAPYDLHVPLIAGKPAAGALVFKVVAPRTNTMPAALAGAQAKSGAAATGAVTFAVLVNGVQQGTVNFAAGATAATFTFAAAVTLNAGDVVTITAPAVQDATLADIAMTIPLT